MNNYIIKNAIVFTVNSQDEVIPNGTVIIQNGRIAQVGRSDRVLLPSNLPVIDAKGRMALIPGLIDVHSHSSLLRGFTENRQLMDWLPEYQLEHQVLTEEDAYAAALLCYSEAVKSGTTSVMDMYRYMHRCAEAADQVGLRVNLVPYVATAEGKDFFESIQSNEKLVASHHESSQGKVRVWIGMEHLFYCTPETYRWAADFSRAHDIGIHTHSSEQKEEVAAVVQHFGKRPVELFYERGILGPKTAIAHCVWLSDREIALLADTGTGVAHCPISNAKLACGIAPIPEMLKKGIRIGLGTDGPISNNNLDLFEEMKFTSLLQKNAHLDAAILPAAQMLRMATIGGAALLGLDHQIGSIEVGKEADLVLVDFWKPHLQPIVTDGENPALWNLVFAAKGSDVNRVFVRGELIVENGHLVKIGESSLLEMTQKQTHSLLKRRQKIKGNAVSMIR